MIRLLGDLDRRIQEAQQSGSDLPDGGADGGSHKRSRALNFSKHLAGCLAEYRAQVFSTKPVFVLSAQVGGRWSAAQAWQDLWAAEVGRLGRWCWDAAHAVTDSIMDTAW